MTPFTTWRARLPATVATWFARDLVRDGLALAAEGRVTLQVVEDAKVDATVRDPRGPDRRVQVEWAGGTGPLALRAVCSDGGNGICAHIVATLEAVRSQTDGAQSPQPEHDDLAWLPAPRSGAVEQRARCVWLVFSRQNGSLGASLLLDSPRLRGAPRDAASILAMMEATPADDWDEADRDLVRDDAASEAFSGRSAPKALSRALVRVASHPRLRYDDDPSAGRHPSDLPQFTVDMRGVRLFAQRAGRTFVPALEDADGRRFSPSDGVVVDGPPAWLATTRGAYLLDGAFDPHAVIVAAREAATQAAESSNDGAVEAKPSLSPAAALRLAPYLAADDRAALGIVDAAEPGAEIAVAWTRGALIAALTFLDRATGARAPLTPVGAAAAVNGGFVYFGPALAQELRSRMLQAGFVPRSGDTFALQGADRAAEFAREVLPHWTDLEQRLDSSLRDVMEAGGVDIALSAFRSNRAQEDRDWFELRLDVFVGADQERLTEEEIATLLSGSGRFGDVRGRLVDLERLRNRRALLDELTGRRQSGLAALVALHDELRHGLDRVELPPEVEQLRERLRNFAGIERVEPPPLTNGALRAYQERGLDFLAYLSSFSFGGILADDMGLGKTVTTLSYLLLRKRKDGLAPSLVIAPSSVTHTWEHEVARFAPELRTLRLHSGPERAAKYAAVEDVDLVITSYALARLDAETLARYRFRTLILDEAQHAKNPASQIARVLRGLRAEHRLALTGTPVENSLRDLWSIFAFVEPGLLGSETSFRRRFEQPIATGDERAAATLRARLEPFLLRRTKDDVAPELPERIEVELECDLSPLQRRLYRGVAEAARRDVFAQIDATGIERATVHVLAALTRLRQICAHPALLFPEYRADPEASGKFDAFIETVEDVLAGGHRVLVFSAFAAMLRIMRERLQQQHLAYGYLDGSTPDRERRTEVERFMRPDGPPVFLCSLKAGGVGLTLTAADYVVLYDPWWNPAVERQAIDRTHRIGQHRPVTAYRLITQGTVEEKIRDLAGRKAELSESVIKADSAAAKLLSRAEIEALLADPV